MDRDGLVRQTQIRILRENEIAVRGFQQQRDPVRRQFRRDGQVRVPASYDPEDRGELLKGPVAKYADHLIFAMIPGTDESVCSFSGALQLGALV